MSTKDDGGFAFPGKGITGYRKSSGVLYSENHPGDPVYGDLPGMSLRDWFAGQALTGLLAAPIGKMPSLTSTELIADEAYATADHMLSAREKKE